MSDREPIVVCKLGRISYEPSWRLQQRIQERLIRAKRSSPPEKLEHVMLAVEHPHVYTLGKSGNRANLLASDDDLQKSGSTFVHIDRGGDITYHGPGQLVVYPILDLDRFFTDIHRYLRELEEVVIRTCAAFHVDATRIPGRTGVWITSRIPDGALNEASVPIARKICAMGIRCSRWVTMHGIGFNLNTDLNRYSQIIPCGIADADVTSLARETATEVNESLVQSILFEHMEDLFSARLTILEQDRAEAFLRMYLETEELPAL